MALAGTAVTEAPKEPTGPVEAEAASPDEPATPTVEVVEGGEDVGRLPLPRRPRGECFGIPRQSSFPMRVPPSELTRMTP